MRLAMACVAACRPARSTGARPIGDFEDGPSSGVRASCPLDLSAADAFQGRRQARYLLSREMNLRSAVEDNSPVLIEYRRYVHAPRTGFPAPGYLVMKFGADKCVSEAQRVRYRHLEPRMPGVVRDEFVPSVARGPLIGCALPCRSFSEILAGRCGSQVERP